MENLVNAIEAIARQNPEGFTIYIPSLEFVNHGWVIANKATQGLLGREGLEKAVEFALRYNRIVGGYLNHRGEFQYDASIVEPDQKTAEVLMELHQQDSIYSIDEGRLIWR